jgi:hypothetical protein
MEINISLLAEKIEKLRALLHNLINSNKQLTDKRVVDCSQELDILLSEYESYKKKLPPSDAA